MPILLACVSAGDGIGNVLQPIALTKVGSGEVSRGLEPEGHTVEPRCGRHPVPAEGEGRQRRQRGS
jgi:hypothetical protein